MGIYIRVCRWQEQNGEEYGTKIGKDERTGSHIVGSS